MPITSSEIKFFKSSSGVGLGGPISLTEIITSVMNNVFDDIFSAEAIAGDTEYRCIYVQNIHPSLSLLSAVLYLSANTTSVSTEVEIGLDPAGVNQPAQVIGAEGTAPAGVSFSTAPDYDNGLSLGDLPANGGYIGVWIKRTVQPGAAAVAQDSCTLTVDGETTA